MVISRAASRFFLYQPHPGSRLETTTSAPQTGHPPSRASLRWWTKSRCDSVCLRSRHFMAWLRRGLAHDAMAIQTPQLSQSFPKLNAGSLLRNSICKYLFLQYVTFVAKVPKLPAASPLASLSPQRGEGLRVRGGHIQSRLLSVSSCISTTRRPS